MISEEKKNAIRVCGTLEIIDNTDFSKITSEYGKQILGNSLARIVLQNLPEKVGTYEHSEDFPFIIATRYEGEVWNQK